MFHRCHTCQYESYVRKPVVLYSTDDGAPPKSLVCAMERKNQNAGYACESQQASVVCTVSQAKAEKVCTYIKPIRATQSRADPYPQREVRSVEEMNSIVNRSVRNRASMMEGTSPKGVVLVVPFSIGIRVERK
jgi:hypothetical protein